MTNTTEAAELPEALTDSQYIQQLAGHYAGSPVPEIARHYARLFKIVEALRAAQAGVPAGQVLVPVDATDAMMAAFAKAVAAEIDWHGATEGERQEVRDGFSPAYRAMLAAAPQPAPSPAPAQPVQAFDSLRAKSLMRAWGEGWEACRDAEYVGEEAQNDAFNSSHTLILCLAEDQLLPPPQADSVQTETDEFVTLIAECRDAFPAPQPGDPLEAHWMAAMCDPGEVPGYLREVAARSAPQPATADTSNLSCKSVQKRLATQWGYVPATADALDAARLDWLEKRGSVAIERCKYLDSDDLVIEVTPYHEDSHEGVTLRAAIDAAMAAKREVKP